MIQGRKQKYKPLKEFLKNYICTLPQSAVPILLPTKVEHVVRDKFVKNFLRI
jgi:hypothetical protein